MSMDDHPGKGIDANTGKPAATSAGRLFGWNTIYGREGEHATPYMTRIWIGRLRLHIFHRGDQDEDCHDHPWDFWTFPLTPYVEQVATAKATLPDTDDLDDPAWLGDVPDEKMITRTSQVVPAWRWTFRPAEHCHRVLGRAAGWLERGVARKMGRPCPWRDGKIVTLVWRGPARRKWGFLKNRDGKWCWVGWKDYVFGGGKSAPCE